MKKHAAPIIAVLLLLLPLLYIGSYLALVDPSAVGKNLPIGSRAPSPLYRVGGRWSERFFWPLEQIDRRLRPKRGLRLDSP